MTASVSRQAGAWRQQKAAPVGAAWRIFPYALLAILTVYLSQRVPGLDLYQYWSFDPGDPYAVSDVTGPPGAGSERPWPGRSGTMTRYPRAARSRAT